MSWTVIEADGNGVRETRRGGTLTGETLAEVAEAKRDRAIAWADITRREIPAEMDGGQDTSTGGTQAGETEAEAGLKPERRPLVAVRSLPPDYTPPQFPWQVLKPDAASDQRAEPEPDPEPKPKFVTWRKCVPADRGQWIESGQIPAGWVALEAHTRPVETIKQLPEGQEP